MRQIVLVLIFALLVIPFSFSRTITLDCAEFEDPDSCRSGGCTWSLYDNQDVCIGETGTIDVPDQTCSDFSTENECASGEGCTWENNICIGDGLIRVDGSIAVKNGDEKDLFVDDTNGFLYTYALGVGPNDDDFDQGLGCDVDSEPIFLVFLINRCKTIN